MSESNVFSKVLIFGKLPPPIGGVTTSIKNLVEILSFNNIEFRLFDYSLFELSSVFRLYDLSHINSSSPFKRLLSLIIGRIVSKKVVFVIHGNRFDHNKIINRICLALTSGVIVLNQDVKNSILKTGFGEQRMFLQSPVLKSPVKKIVGSEFSFLKEKYLCKSFVTLYSNHGGFLDGKEVYGFSFFFSKLIGFFNASEFVFIVVDLDGKFKEVVDSFTDRFEILYYNKPVNFLSLLSCTDFYIRPTNFDGSSVAVLEALQLNVKVIASNVVDRPSGVFVYDVDDESSFFNALKKARNEDGSSEYLLSEFSHFVDFYKDI